MKIPTKIAPSTTKPNTLAIAWADGSTGEVPYSILRLSCPCASCVDEHTGERTIRPEDVDPNVRTTGAQVVGNYAIQFRFSDGHATGIFSFDTLAKACNPLTP